MKRREIEPLLVTIAEAAPALRVGEKEVRSWVEAGVLPSVQWTPTSPRLIPVVALERLVAERSGVILRPEAASA